MNIPPPVSSYEAELFEFLKQVAPAYAFANGLDEFAGRLFIPSERNLEKLSRKVQELRTGAETESQRKRLDSLESSYLLREPHQFPGSVLNSYSVHLTKEGIVTTHMKSLTTNAIKGMQVATRENALKDWPTGQKILTLIRCDGIQKVLTVVRRETPDAPLKELTDTLSEATKKYASLFKLNGFTNGSFEEIHSIIESVGAELGRDRIYPSTLKSLWDYRETPSEIDEIAMKSLEREMPMFERICTLLAKRHECGEEPEEVVQAIRNARSLNPSEIIPFMQELRQRTVKVVNENLIRVNDKYETEVMEMPSYLSGIVPSASAYSFDGFTDKPREVFMINTSLGRGSKRTPSELLHLLVHEEYGHNVHSSNSSVGARPSLTDILWSPLKAIMLGIYFQREIEFLGVMEKLRDGKGLSNEEKTLAGFFERQGGMEAFASEYEFHTRMWRVIRFLRAIGDARINSGRQSLLQFIEWAHTKTRLPEATIYYQLFPAHQGWGPGYAAIYAIMGERIREIQSIALRNGKKLIDFNTYACSIGYPPRSIFEDRLLSFANS